MPKPFIASPIVTIDPIHSRTRTSGYSVRRRIQSPQGWSLDEELIQSDGVTQKILLFASSHNSYVATTYDAQDQVIEQYSTNGFTRHGLQLQQNEKKTGLTESYYVHGVPVFHALGRFLEKYHIFRTNEEMLQVHQMYKKLPALTFDTPAT